nr:hypothetical protein [uncultured Halomonas sp.]
MTMTVKRYLDDRSVHGSAVITELLLGEKTAVRLDKTLFHPQGGGQKADRGFIASIPILHVRHGANGAIDHYIADPECLKIGMGVEIFVDSRWRQLNATYHTAGHLLAGIAEELLDNIHATCGHHWPGEARVEFKEMHHTINLDRWRDELTEALNQRLKQYIESALPVIQLGDTHKNREIKIGNFDPIPCGGTHLENLMELKEVRVTGMKRKKGVLRISYSAYPE